MNGERTERDCPVCNPDFRVELEQLIHDSGECWVHVDGHGDSYAATEDAGYLLPVCNPCFGAVGRYSAVWFCPDRGEFRCSGCLFSALIHPELAELERREYETSGEESV